MKLRQKPTTLLLADKHHTTDSPSWISLVVLQWKSPLHPKMHSPPLTTNIKLKSVNLFKRLFSPCSFIKRKKKSPGIPSHFIQSGQRTPWRGCPFCPGEHTQSRILLFWYLLYGSGRTGRATNASAPDDDLCYQNGPRNEKPECADVERRERIATCNCRMDRQ